MKQLLLSVKFLYENVLKENIDADFNNKTKMPSRIPMVILEKEVEET